MKRRKCFSLIILFTFLLEIFGLISEIPIPETLEACRNRRVSKESVSTVESMDTYCIRHHKMLIDRPYLLKMNITEDTTNWINELLRMSEMDHHSEVQYQRVKRQALVDVPTVPNQSSNLNPIDAFSVQASNQNTLLNNQVPNFQQTPGNQISNQQFQSANIATNQFGQPTGIQGLQQQLTGVDNSNIVIPEEQQQQQQFNVNFQGINNQQIFQQQQQQQQLQQQQQQQQLQLNQQQILPQVQFNQNQQFQQQQQQQQQTMQFPSQQDAQAFNQQSFIPQVQSSTQQETQFTQAQNPSAEQFISQSRNENHGLIRVRKEYRMLTDQERQDFHAAVNMLKRDTSVQPNRYDALALLHFRLTNNIHHGSAFLPWHRTFITIFENALRQKIPTVTLPYFDSSMDESLLDPTLSIMWSPEFMGNGNGLVTTGPFAYWQTPSGPLIRNLGAAGGSLLSREDIFTVLSRVRLQDIAEPNAADMFNVEEYHGDVHTWIGGEMEPMETSAFDPIFYLHHCFIDYLWEIFQNRQRSLGIDPTTDYPQDPGGPTHSLQARMGFGDLRNSFGLSDFFTNEVYTYLPNPSCSVRSPSCGSRYLTCDMTQGIAQCLPLTVRINQAASVPSQRQQFQSTVRQQTPAGSFASMPNFVAPSPVVGKRKKRQARKYDSALHNSTGELSPIGAPTSSCAASWLSFSSQNTFEVNGESDTRKWVFIPIRVVNKRSPEHRKFKAFPIYNGRASISRDIYNPDAYPEIRPYFSEKIMPASRICNHRESDRTVGKIHIESNGLNYHGNYDEYVVVDLRQALSESTTYIAMKDPTNSETEAIISAYDTCGRRCRAYCRYTDNKTGKIGYKKCTGAVKVTDEFPRMYGKNYGDAVRTSWTLHNLEDIPEIKTESIFLQFYCDHTDG